MIINIKKTIKNTKDVMKCELGYCVLEAWDDFKDLLCACPHHGFMELHQLDTFYNTLTPVGQDSFNVAAGGNLLTKTPRDALTIIENKSKVRNLRNKPVVKKVSTNAPSSTPHFPEIAALAEAVKAIFLQKSSPPASVKAVEEICVTCGGPHPYHQCLAIDGNVFLEYQDNIQGYVSVAAVNYNQGNTEYRPQSVANQIRPPVVDYVFVPRVPLILERPFLRTGQALIDVYGKELTLRVDDEAITFKVGQTSKYSYNDAKSVNRIDVIDVDCEEYVQEVLVFSEIPKSGNPTPIPDPIIALSSPPLTLFKGVEVVLGQRKTKHFQPIHHASKTMTNAQSHYTTTEKELLAVVYAFEKFRPYLVLSKTIVYTDHSTLKYLLAKQDAKLRLLWWILLLQEFDVVIRDKKGAKNLVADHLSRLENPHQSDLEKKEITKTFTLETLGMITFRGDSSTSWFADIANYHAENFIGIDFMGPFPSSRGNKYILVAIDYLSKWVEAKALPTNDSRVVVKFLKSLFAQFGTPRAIISDRGTHFCNDQFAKVMLKYGVTHRLSTMYHPQTSGEVKVSNHGLKRIIEKTIGENRASWSDKLDDALWALRTTFKTLIGCTPYKLVY
nr:hypothetical protein [Tanacetum cinerariifolium]